MPVLTPPKILPVGQWLPDHPDFGNPGITVARNVTPLSNESYGPIPGLQPVGFDAIPDQVLGVFTFVDSSEQEHIFVGTPARLYHLRTGDTAFEDVSRLDANDNPLNYNAYLANPWSMTSFGPSIIATNGIDPPQTFQPGVDDNFSNLADYTAAVVAVAATDTEDAVIAAAPKNAAPVGRFVATVRNWVMFGNINDRGSIYPNRVIWSAIGDPAYWPLTGTLEAASVQSDFNDLRSDLGWIRGIVSNLQSCDAAIFLDHGVYSVSHVGSPATFGFSLAQNAAGCRVSSSIVVNRGRAFYLGQDGFYVFDGVNAQGIGAQRVDNWFFNNEEDGVDPAYVSLVQGAVDTSGRLIMWLYPSNGSNGTLDRIIIYSWLLDRWSMGRVTAQWASKGISLGYSLDQLNIFGTVDTITPSFDSPVWKGGAPRLYVVDALGRISTFTGETMAARVETLEVQFAPGARTRVTNSRPLVDGGPALVSMGTRNRLLEDVTWTPLVPQNYHGECPQRVDARYVRARIDIPSPASIFEFVCIHDSYDATLNAGAAQAPVGMGEVATATDTVDAAFVVSATGLVEAASSTDTTSATAIFGFVPPLSVIEPVTATDSYNGNLGFAEAANATDSQGATVTRAAALAEAATATDALAAPHMVRAVAVAETNTASDAVGGGRGLAVAVTESNTATDAPDGTVPADSSMAAPAGYSSGDLLGEDLFTSASLDLTKWVPWEGWHASARIGSPGAGGGNLTAAPYSGNAIGVISISGGFRVNLTNSSTSATLVWNAGVPNGLTNGTRYYINDRNSLISPTCVFTYGGSTNSTSGSQSITLIYAATGSTTNRAVTVTNSINGIDTALANYEDPFPYCQAANPVSWSGLDTWSGLSNTSPGDLAGGVHLQGGGGVMQLTICPTTSISFLALGWSTVGACVSARTGGNLILPQTGGYIQIRAKMPDSRYGAWPSIWLMPDNGSGNEVLEIDLQEGGYTQGFDPNRCIASAFHNGGTATMSGLFDDQSLAAGGFQVLSQNDGVDLTADYHIYGMELIPGTSIKTYFDGVQMGEWTSGVPNTTDYALILVNGFSAPVNSWRTLFDPAHPGPFTMYVNNVQVYGL